jgi:hypothetical protein
MQWRWPRGAGGGSAHLVGLKGHHAMSDPCASLAVAANVVGDAVLVAGRHSRQPQRGAEGCESGKPHQGGHKVRREMRFLGKFGVYSRHKKEGDRVQREQAGHHGADLHERILREAKRPAAAWRERSWARAVQGVTARGAAHFICGGGAGFARPSIELHL